MQIPSFAGLHYTKQNITTNQNQINKGKTLYDAGRFSEAVQVLQQAVQDYTLSGNVLKQAATLGNLSLAYQQLGQWEQAKQALELSLRLQDKTTNKNLLAQTLSIQGRLLFSTGQTEEALLVWQQAEKLFIQADNINGSLKARLNQVQSLQILGFNNKAIKLIKEVNTTIGSQSNTIEKVGSLRLLGEVLQLVGDFDTSRKALEQSLEIARSLNDNTEVSLSLLSLGNSALVTRQQEQALNYYEQTASISPSPQIKVKARLNQLRILVNAKKYTEAKTLISLIESIQLKLLPSRSAIYALLNFADNLTKIGNSYMQRSYTLIGNAIEMARDINDKHAYAYALGQLGNLYEKTHSFSKAQQLTQKALAIAQAEKAAEITYQLQWQLGRLLRLQININGAIKYYDAAINTLSTLREDLVSVHQDTQFSFKESVEPVYRESVALLLQSYHNRLGGRPDAEILDKARQRIEALQVAELDDFFREACITGRKVVLDKVVDEDNPNTAILYPIILESMLQVIVKIPHQPLKLYTTQITPEEFKTTLTQLRRDLINPAAIQSLKTHSQKLYKWLLQEIEPDLTSSNINTLVFIPDTVLRNIPFSSLYDGKKYLVEKYAISINTGLQLLEPQPLEKQRLNALTAGLTNPPLSHSNFSSLPAIKSELEQIRKTGIDTTTLLDHKFTRKELEYRVKDIPFNVVHLATHGQFSSRAEDTFVLAADGPINVRQFDNLLRSRNGQKQAVQLLVLSACETASGDERAALGLAGVAIKAGARSTVASLWQIDDESTAKFVGHFYNQLKDAKVSKVKALQLAQLELLKHPNYQAPSYWAPYVMIGNWL